MAIVINFIPNSLYMYNFFNLQVKKMICLMMYMSPELIINYTDGWIDWLSGVTDHDTGTARVSSLSDWSLWSLE